METLNMPQNNMKDLLILIKKIDQDYKMIDSKLIEILNRENSRKKVSKELFKLIEKNNELLIKLANERNDIIKEIQKLLKNPSI